MHTATRTAARNAWLMLALLTVAAPVIARGDDRFYVGPHNGLWSDPANWSATSGGAGGASVPVAGDRVFLDNATATDISTILDLSYTSPGPLHLYLDGSNGFTNTVSQTSAALEMTATQQFIGDTGSGRYIHTSGLNAAPGGFVVGNMATGTGTYELGGGTLSVAEEVIGQWGSGTFLQSGGHHSASLGMYLGAAEGSSGRFDLSGGTLDITGSHLVGETGTGVFTQSGGVLLVSLNSAVGNQSGGIGTFHHTAGSSTVGGYLAIANSPASGTLAASRGAYHLGADAVLTVGVDIGVGGFGVGTFSHHGGSVDVVGGLFVGLSDGGDGLYNFTNGTLNVGFSGMIIGWDAGSRGEFIKSGGIGTVATNVVVGRFAGSVGTFTHSGGTMTIGGNLMTYQGEGVINISGGTVMTNGNVDNGSYTISGGVINLSGGFLYTNYIFNEGIFNHTGGTFSGTLVGNGVYNFNPGPGIVSGTGVATLSHASVTINNTGSINWTGGDIAIAPDSSGSLTTIRNFGEFFLPDSGEMRVLDNGTGSMLNAGGTIKPVIVGSVGTTTIGAPLNRRNTGQLTLVNDNGSFQINSGTLIVNADFVTTPASLTTISGAGTMILNGPQDWGAGSTLRITDGQTVLNANIGATNRPAVQVLTGGTLHANVTQRIASLSIDAGGTFDIDDNGLIVASTTPLSQVQAYITGDRLLSSAVMQSTTLGLLTGAQYFAIYGNDTPFDGLSILATDTLVKYTYFGDSDFNGVINFDDYARIDAGFNNGGNEWFEGDFNYDQVVNFDDYALIDLAFNTQTGLLRPVPEPTSGILLFAILGISRRRNSR